MQENKKRKETSNTQIIKPAQTALLSMPASLRSNRRATVTPQEIAFCFFTFLYSTLLPKFAFPPPTPRCQPPVFGPQNRALAVYVSAGAVVGLLLPVAYMLEGIARGDKEGLRTAAPQLFLLSAQLFMEGVSFSR